MDDDDAIMRDNRRRTPPPPEFQFLTTSSMTNQIMLYSMSSSTWLNNSLHHPRSQGLYPTLNQHLPPPPPVNHISLTPPPAMGAGSTAASSSTSRSRPVRNHRSKIIPPPFPWATNIRGKIHTLEYLESQQITTITGEVQCRDCKKTDIVSYNVRERFREVEKIFTMKKRMMRERAPRAWTNPGQGTCERCGHANAVKPVIAIRKHQINWLFLLLGQTLGHCTLGQLKSFCKHSNCHRTGAKDRLLYLTYLGLCKMLEPTNVLFHL